MKTCDTFASIKVEKILSFAKMGLAVLLIKRLEVVRYKFIERTR